MINIDKLTKGQKLYYIGNGVESCEVHVDKVYMSTCIRYGEKRFEDHTQQEDYSRLYAIISVVVLLPNNSLRVLTPQDKSCYFYSEEDCKQHILDLHEKLTKEY